MNPRTTIGLRMLCLGTAFFLTGLLLAGCGGSDDTIPPAVSEPSPSNPAPAEPSNPVPPAPAPVPTGLAKYVGQWEACSSAFLKTTYSITVNENGSLGLATKGSYYTGPGCTGSVRAELTRAPRLLSHVAQTTRTGSTGNSTHYPEINVVAAFDDFVSTGTAGWTLVGNEVYETVQFGRNWCIGVPGGGNQCYFQEGSTVTNNDISMHQDGTFLYVFDRFAQDGPLHNGIPFQKTR